MREPPQRKLRPKIAAIHGCDSTAAKEPFTIFLALCSDLWPHDSSAETRRTSSEKSREGEQRPEGLWSTCVRYSGQGFYCRSGACEEAEAVIRKQRDIKCWRFLFRVRLTHGNSTEFPHKSSFSADVAPWQPALVKISRIDVGHQ